MRVVGSSAQAWVADEATQARCYADRYGDLRNAFGYNVDLLKNHFKSHGYNEGRTYDCDAGAGIVTNTAGMCCGKSDAVWTTDGKGQLSKRVDTSACNFKNSNVVYITSLGGKEAHFRLTGTTAYSDSSSTHFTMDLREHPTQKTPEYAKQMDWHVNWCGVGDAGAPGAPTPPAPPGPAPGPPPPPPPATEKEMPTTAKGINNDCAKWRDRSKKPLRDQMKNYVYCMQQDCMQSMEAVSCRFLDPHGFCYTDSGQKFCEANKPHSLCTDLGAEALSTNLGGKGAWAPSLDVSTYGSDGSLETSKPHFTCSCAKKCVWYKGELTRARCDIKKGGPIKVGNLKNSPLPDMEPHQSGKDKDCACACCFPDGTCYDSAGKHYLKSENFSKKHH